MRLLEHYDDTRHRVRKKTGPRRLKEQVRMLAVNDKLSSIRFSLTEDLLRGMLKSKGMALNNVTRQDLRVAVRRVADDSIPVLIIQIAEATSNPPPHYCRITRRKRQPNWYDFTVNRVLTGILPPIGTQVLNYFPFDQSPGMLGVSIPDECWVHTIREIDIERVAQKQLERRKMTARYKEARRRRKAQARLMAMRRQNRIDGTKAILDADPARRPSRKWFLDDDEDENADAPK